MSEITKEQRKKLKIIITTLISKYEDSTMLDRKLQYGGWDFNKIIFDLLAALLEADPQLAEQLDKKTITKINGYKEFLDERVKG